MTKRPSWIEELNVEPGDHVLAIVTDEEDNSLLPPYAADGMAKGHQCNVFAQSQEIALLRQYMRDHDVAVDEGERSGQLTFSDPREFGRNPAGEFEMELLVQNLKQFAQSLSDQNVDHLRCMGSLAWLKGSATANDGIYLCARLNEIFKGRPVSGL